MSVMKMAKGKHAIYLKTSKNKQIFSSPLALGLLESVPRAKDPIEAILWHAQMLFVESGMSEPPFAPANYAPLRRVKEIVCKNMEVDGRLIPGVDGFIIELRKDRSHERKNFTCAHELGHTFFYESVPSIKYRALASNQPHHDEEEERLCNIAASELLMPSSVISKIGKEFSPSPQSLQKIAQIFETSLTATIVKLLSLKIWNATFVLWDCEDNKIKAKWLARPSCNLVYSPKFELVNFKTTSVYKTFVTGEALDNMEWFSLDNYYKLSRFQSLRLNAKTVLSCFMNSSNQTNSSLESKTVDQELPFNYKCECDGTGWCSHKKDGISYATRCKASEHKKIILNLE